MQDWLKAFHGENPPFPVIEIAVRLAVALAVGLVVGFEREWSNKDIGVRTFAMTSLLGLLAALLGPPSLWIAGAAVLILMVFANLRGMQPARKSEVTTSIALAVVFLLGILVGKGHLFTPVTCAILATMLLSLKPQLQAFAGGLKPQEVRSALLLGLLGFVICPLLPDHFIDPWGLFNPRAAWITVVVIACLGFVNYVLLRVYGSRGIYITAILGGLVNSTATAAELISTLAQSDMLDLSVAAILLTSVSMYFRNLLILAIFARPAIRTAALPLVAMALVAAYWIYRDRRKIAAISRDVTLDLGSPVSLSRVTSFGLLFLILQVVATLGQRFLGNAGFQIVSFVGGLFSSASTAAAAANLSMHGKVSPSQAGIAVVLTSVSSALVDLPIVRRKAKPVMPQLLISSLLQILIGAAVIVLQSLF